MVEISSEEIDTLKEVANIGAGNASVPLSNLLLSKVDLEVGQVKVISTKNVNADIEEKKIMVGLHTPIVKGMAGHIVIMFSMESLVKLVNSLKGIEKDEGALTEEDQKFLKGVGSVLSTSYIGALNQFLGMSLECGKTNLIATFGESVVALILAQIEKEAPAALLIKTSFRVLDRNLDGDFMFLLAIPSVDKLLEQIRQNY